jgi:hypothetical protein
MRIAVLTGGSSLESNISFQSGAEAEWGYSTARLRQQII